MAIASRDLAATIPDRTVRHRLSGEDLARYALVVVFAVVLYLFVLYPMGQLAWRSLHDNQGRFVGAANYARYFGTPAIASSRPQRRAMPSPTDSTVPTLRVSSLAS